MPGIEMDSPLAAGFGAAAGLIGGYSQGKQQAAEQKRQAELDRQNAIATAIAQKHQSFEEGRETRSDSVADEDLGLRKSANARAVIAATDESNQRKLDLKVTQANYKLQQMLAPLQVKKAILDTQFQRGQLDAQQYSIQSAQAQALSDQVAARLAVEFGVPKERLALAQGNANLDATGANTAATRQNTAFGAEDHSLNRALGQADLVGKNLNNVAGARGLMTPTANPALTVDPSSDPHAKLVATETDAAQKSYATEMAKLHKNDDGKWVDKDDNEVKDDALPKKPEDFETFTNNIDTLLPYVAGNPKALAHTVKKIDEDPDMSPAQKSYAKRRLTEASKMPKPAAPSTGGAAGAGSPFGSSQIVNSAASEFGVPAAIMDSIWQQESGRGSGLSADGTSPTPGNAGHGWFQLDPASGAPPDVLARAAKDPVYASRVAANQLKQLYAQYGSWPAAIEAYNAGHPGTAKGQQYAAQVLARTQQ